MGGTASPARIALHILESGGDEGGEVELIVRGVEDFFDGFFGDILVIAEVDHGAHGIVDEFRRLWFF